MNIRKKTFALYVITKHGIPIAEKIMSVMNDCDLYVSERLFDQAPDGAILMPLSMKTTLKDEWPNYYCHIHVISIGAVVRMTKDFMVNKKVDPAVICIDDASRFVISVLSGHVGKGNLYTNQIAESIGATPVVTTASDSIGTLTVDILGREFGWDLDDEVHNVTKACADVVNGCRVAFIQETGEPDFWPLAQELPEGVEYYTNINEVMPSDFEMLLIATDKKISLEYYNNSVIYRPKSLVLGLGCDRHTPLEVVEAGIHKFLDEEKLSIKSVKAFVSVDKKADEVALIELSDKYDIPFITFSAEELDVVEGIENPSEVVKKYVGTRSVAEAASLLYAKSTKLLMPKRAFKLDGGGKNMTCAITRIPFMPRKLN